MLTDQALRGYEKYVTTERNIQETLNMLPQHSEDYLFLRLMHILNESGLAKFDSDKELKDQLQNIKDSYQYRHNERLQIVVFRELFMRYDEAKTPEEKAKVIEKIKEKVGWDHNYTKPTNLKRIKKNVEEVKGGAADDTSEEEDPELAGYKTEFKAEVEFSRQALVDYHITNNNATQIHAVSL